MKLTRRAARSALFADLRPGAVVEHEDGTRSVALERENRYLWFAHKSCGRWEAHAWHEREWNKLARKARQVEEKDS